MSTSDTSSPLPTRQSDRYEILDVLRGFSLLGVLIANLAELGGQSLLATADQLAALPSAETDARTSWFLDLLIFDKANTLFSVLFGIGFWIMWERLSARGSEFERIYLRRITVLTGLGFLHLFGWFAWDILHLYGLMAYVLFFTRRLPDDALLWIGIALFLFSRPVTEWLILQNDTLAAISEAAYTEAAILERQSAALSGDFFTWVSAMNHMTMLEWFLGGFILAWFTYTLGRFYIGAWIARKGWVQNPEDYLGLVKALVLPLLVSGLVLEAAALTIQDAPAGSWGSASLVPELMSDFATPLITGGYVCLLTLVFFSARLSWLVRPFAPVGQMALTNYLVQSPFIIWVLCGFGPGLGLAGQAGSTDLTLIASAFFIAQVIFSHVWMRRYQYGPAEWAWRALTYQTWPQLRR